VFYKNIKTSENLSKIYRRNFAKIFFYKRHEKLRLAGTGVRFRGATIVDWLKVSVHGLVCVKEKENSPVSVVHRILKHIENSRFSKGLNGITIRKNDENPVARDAGPQMSPGS
jgi:hypothetical protein